MVSLENLLKVREPSSISYPMVHWAKTDYYHLHTPYALFGPGPGLVLVGYPSYCFIELYIYLKKKTKKNLHSHTLTHTHHNGHFTTPKNEPKPKYEKKKYTLQDHPGVYGTLPRIGISDHKLLRVQGRLHGLRSVPASIAVKLFHRLDLAYRLPRLCARAPAADRPAWCPAPNHIHILFARRLRRCQLEATELSVPSSHLYFSFPFSFPLSPFFFFFWYLALQSEMNWKRKIKIDETLIVSPPPLHRSSLICVIVRRSGCQPTEHHGSSTKRGDARLAFDKYQCGGRVLKE